MRKMGPLTLAAEVEYQVCNDSVCFPPETVEVKFETSITPPARSVEPTEPELFKGWDPARFATIAKPVAAPAREKVMIFGRELGDKSYLFALRRRFDRNHFQRHALRAAGGAVEGDWVL